MCFSKHLALQLPDELLNNGSTSPCDKPHCTTPTDELKSEWKSCAICLEDMLESALMVHPACNGTLCHSCLEVSRIADVFYNIKATEYYYNKSCCFVSLNVLFIG